MNVWSAAAQRWIKPGERVIVRTESGDHGPSEFVGRLRGGNYELFDEKSTYRPLAKVWSDHTVLDWHVVVDVFPMGDER